MNWEYSVSFTHNVCKNNDINPVQFDGPHSNLIEWACSGHEGRPPKAPPIKLKQLKALSECEWWPRIANHTPRVPCVSPRECFIEINKAFIIMEHYKFFIWRLFYFRIFKFIYQTCSTVSSFLRTDVTFYWLSATVQLCNTSLFNLIAYITIVMTMFKKSLRNIKWIF